jgi:hypothetical protein
MKSVKHFVYYDDISHLKNHKFFSYESPLHFSLLSSNFHTLIRNCPNVILFLISSYGYGLLRSVFALTLLHQTK